MSKLISIALVSAVLASSVSTAEAGRVQRRGRHEAARIREGVRSGQLTRDEAKGLRQDQREIRKMAHDARADGAVTKEERSEIRNAQDAASKNIYGEKHDAEIRQ